MSFGKSTQTTTPQLTEEQKAQIAAQTGFFTGTIAPTYEAAVKGATDVYNVNLPGVYSGAQNLAGTARQAQTSLGETGESALRSGITGLQSLFDPDYERQQVMAAMGPAQAQYLQNIQSQRAQFGGTGQLGSARQALADRALAGQTQSAMMGTAAQISKDIASQRLQAASDLARLGQGGVGQAVGAAGTAAQAAFMPQDLYNRYASVIFGTPAASYSPNFAGTQGQTTSGLSFGAKYGF